TITCGTLDVHNVIKKLNLLLLYVPNSYQSSPRGQRSSGLRYDSNQNINRPISRTTTTTTTKKFLTMALPQGCAITELNFYISICSSITSRKLTIEKLKHDKNFDTPNSQTEGFGPHLLTSPEAINISESARVMIETAKNAMKKLNIEKSQRISVLERVSDSFLNTIQTQARCRFTAGPCNQASQYRTADGSCNNVANPLWGKSHTPFERFIPGFYEDGLDDPRATDFFGDPLPLARDISVNVHTVSDSTTQMNDLSHFSMEFGQFVSHDIQMNALSKGKVMKN
ncbi:Hypothetical predicted protein, partial [Mytilus galloprovincialis]